MKHRNSVLSRIRFENYLAFSASGQRRRPRPRSQARYGRYAKRHRVLTGWVPHPSAQESGLYLRRSLDSYPICGKRPRYLILLASSESVAPRRPTYTDMSGDAERGGTGAGGAGAWRGGRRRAAGKAGRSGAAEDWGGRSGAPGGLGGAERRGAAAASAGLAVQVLDVAGRRLFHDALGVATEHRRPPAAVDTVELVGPDRLPHTAHRRLG